MKAKALTKQEIIQFAIAAELPSGWYDGPWFDDYGELKTGLCPQMVDFVRMIEAASVVLQQRAKKKGL